MHVIARLAALVPKPRVNLTRYHGVFAPNSHRRAQVVPGRRPRRTPVLSVVEGGEETDRTVAAGHAATTPDQVRGRPWVQRLKRVFHIDIETCNHCGGAVKIIACIEDPAVIETTAWMQVVEQRMEQLPKILGHLNAKT